MTLGWIFWIKRPFHAHDEKRPVKRLGVFVSDLVLDLAFGFTHQAFASLGFLFPYRSW